MIDKEEKQLIRDVILDKAFIIDCVWSYTEIALVLMFRTLKVIANWGIIVAMAAIVFIIKPFSYQWFFFALGAYGLLRLLLLGTENNCMTIFKATAAKSKKTMLDLFLDHYDNLYHSYSKEQRIEYQFQQGYYNLVGIVEEKPKTEAEKK